MAPTAVNMPMEQLTVHSASYRPLPLPLRVCRCRTPVKRSLAPSVVTTAHREAYRRRDPQEPIKSKPPPDHGFLAGDGVDRFHCTSYKMHYPVKDGLHRGNHCSQLIKADIRSSRYRSFVALQYTTPPPQRVLREHAIISFIHSLGAYIMYKIPE